MLKLQKKIEFSQGRFNISVECTASDSYLSNISRFSQYHSRLNWVSLLVCNLSLRDTHFQLIKVAPMKEICHGAEEMILRFRKIRTVCWLVGELHSHVEELQSHDSVIMLQNNPPLTDQSAIFFA